MSSKKDCGTCGGSGEIDSGGITPWDTWIMLPCPECSPIQFDVKKHNEQLDRLIEAEAARPIDPSDTGE